MLFRISYFGLLSEGVCIKKIQTGSLHFSKLPVSVIIYGLKPYTITVIEDRMIRQNNYCSIIIFLVSAKFAVLIRYR
jgi:hypothetical protein